ncbi:MAG: trypsin-like peptidase domain-containing protein [Desulfamplus sp.]|nr:trypsin-like peptidase domain-containing protein [Desulfamplus sp.]MBF0388966.1 trypsin-like peptidase domain-containing protein [Desulfamplus sp.]
MIKQIAKFVLFISLLVLMVVQIGSIAIHYIMPKDDAQVMVANEGLQNSNIVLTSTSSKRVPIAVSKVRGAVVYITGRKNSNALLPPSSALISFTQPTSLPGDKMGSGIIIDSRGYIITNYHVVSQITDIQVSLYGIKDRTYPCTIISMHPDIDIAVIKIDTGFLLQTATLGNSDMVEVTDEVIAIGCPFSLEQSVTHGIISDTSRTVDIDGRQYESLLQTDAVINSGNSGGALINMEGEVIGVNVAIYAPSRVYCGVGFAIPINRVKLILMKIQYLQGEGV